MRKLAVLSILTLMLMPPAVLAHHGWGGYEATTPMTIESPVESVLWENPHGELTLQHEGEMWRITLAPLSRLHLRGLSAEMLQPGTVVTAEGYPSRHNPNELRAERIIVGGEPYEMR